MAKREKHSNQHRDQFSVLTRPQWSTADDMEKSVWQLTSLKFGERFALFISNKGDGTKITDTPDGVCTQAAWCEQQFFEALFVEEL